MVDNTYLKVIVIPSILEDGEMMPETGFLSPQPKGMSYQDYLSYLDTGLPSESPKLYGLHLNAEIAYLNSATSNVLGSILRLKAGSGGGGSGGGGGIADAIVSMLETVHENY